MGTIQGSIVLLQEEGKVGFSMLIHEAFFFVNWGKKKKKANNDLFLVLLRETLFLEASCRRLCGGHQTLVSQRGTAALLCCRSRNLEVVVFEC